jgi:hypothetical protein
MEFPEWSLMFQDSRFEVLDDAVPEEPENLALYLSELRGALEEVVQKAKSAKTRKSVADLQDFLDDLALLCEEASRKAKELHNPLEAANLNLPIRWLSLELKIAESHLQDLGNFLAAVAVKDEQNFEVEEVPQQMLFEVLLDNIPAEPEHLAKYMEKVGETLESSRKKALLKPNGKTFAQFQDLLKAVIAICQEASKKRDKLPFIHKGAIQLRQAVINLRREIKRAEISAFELDNMLDCYRAAEEEISQQQLEKPAEGFLPVSVASEIQEVEKKAWEPVSGVLEEEHPVNKDELQINPSELPTFKEKIFGLVQEPVALEDPVCEPAKEEAEQKLVDPDEDTVQVVPLQPLGEVQLSPQELSTSSSGKEEEKLHPEKKDMQSNMKFPREVAGKKTQQRVPYCPLCSTRGHSLASCRQFKKLTPNERFWFCQEKNLHFRCLERHPADQCRIPEEQQRCPKKAGCWYRHHELLHDARPHQKLDSSSSKNQRRPSKVSKEFQLDGSSFGFSSAIKLMKVYVRPHNSNGGQVRRVEVAVDHRENKSMVEKELAKELQLKMSASGLAFDVSQDGKTWHSVVDASVVKKFELEGREPNWAEFQDQNPDFQTFDLAFNYASRNPVKILLGADVQDLWMPTERRKKWIQARRLLGYQTKLGLAVSGPFLGIHRISSVLEEQYKKQERFQKNSRARLMSFQPKNNHEQRKKREDSSVKSEKFQLPAPAVDELVQWIKTSFKRSEETIAKKYQEVCQQLIHQVADVFKKSGFLAKNKGLMEVQEYQHEEEAPSCARVRKQGMIKRSTQVSRTRSVKKSSRPIDQKVFHGSKRRSFPGSSLNPEEWPALPEVRLRRVFGAAFPVQGCKRQVVSVQKISHHDESACRLSC